MIGETLYEGKGRMNVNRIISGGDGIGTPTIELTLVGQGKARDVEVNEVWTFIATIHEDDSAFADGQGIISTKSRDNRQLVVASAKGMGIAHKEEEKNRSQFVIFYNAKNPKARGALNFLDKKVCVARLCVNDETMEYTVDVREWKLQ